MQKSKGLDNPQARSGLHKLSWLGGIIDGEGCVVLASRGEASRGTRELKYVPRITIVNTDWRVMDKVVAIFKEYKLPFYLHRRKPRKKHYKEKIELEVSGYKRIHKVLPVIVPYLIAKRKRAEWLFAYVDSRLRNYRKPMTYGEKKLIEKLRSANGKPDTAPETIRGTW